MSSDRLRSIACGSGRSDAWMTTSWSLRCSTRAPRARSSSNIVSTSRIRGTLPMTTSSDVRAAAARIGSAAFLLPAGTTSPASGWPPSIKNFSMRRGRVPGAGAGTGRSARVTTMSVRLSREDAWTLLTEWVESPGLRRHCQAVSAAMEAYAPRFDGDPEQWAVVGLLHDMDYERFPDMDDPEKGHPRSAMAELERRDADPAIVRAIASHADFMGVEPVSPMEKTLRAVDELSGFLLACSYVRPEGIVGLTPKSVKKKLKQPSFAAAVSRDDVRGGADVLGVDFDEHVAFVIAALEARADELELRGSGTGTPA